ncbi:MAG: flagellar hook-basal body complex protein [bacterium]
MALLNSFSSGVSAVKTFGKNLEVIGDNIANVNTTGFKGSRVTNQDNFSETLEYSSSGAANAGGAAGAVGTNSMQIGSGTSIASISQQFTQGVLSTTGGPADLGVSGKGFFKVLNSATNEYFYTRAGDFRLDDTGKMLTNQGYQLVGAAGPIVIPPTSGTPPTALQSYSIDKAGNVNAYYSGSTTATSIDQILLTTFANPNALQRESGNMLSNPGIAGGANGGAAGATIATAGPTATQAGDIIQGTLELSNVDLTQQFSDLIVAQRAFQAGSRVITVSDSVMEEIVNLKR